MLALAGAFQFTSLKDACLDKCRHPGQFLMRYYERGAGGGLRLGMRHGAFCVGCCWALMLVMFAAGVASLIWMALLTAVMIHEKTRPAGARAVPVTGVALLAAASVVLAYSAAAAARLSRPASLAEHMFDGVSGVRSREGVGSSRIEKHLSIDEIADRLALAEDDDLLLGPRPAAWPASSSDRGSAQGQPADVREATAYAARRPMR